VSSGVMLPPAAWKLCQTFLVHGLTVAAVLSSDEWMHLPCDLDCVEIFAGVGSIAAAAAEKGLRSATYDKLRIPGITEQTEDITTLQGFRGAIALVLRLVSHGLLWLAPDCSSWGFMNCSRCKRSEDNGYIGDVTYSKVVTGNAITESSVFLTLLAAARGVEAALENPGGSAFFKYGPVVEMEHALGMVAACTYRCAFSVAPFGKRIKKKYNFLATSSWIRGVFAACRCPGNLHLPLTSKRISKNGRVQTNGIKTRLLESGAYPIALGQRVVECACPGQADRGTSVEVVESKLRKPSHQQKTQKVRLPKRVRKLYTKKSTSPVSSVSRPVSRGSGPVSKARVWAAPAASSGTRASLRPVSCGGVPVKARAWCTPSASSSSGKMCGRPMSSSASKERSWCTPSATSSSKPSDARAAGRAWLQPHSEGAK